MAKIRTIKPEFFRHELLFEAEKSSQLPLRIAFAGLFCCCDREGRFRWLPRQLKLDILPYDDIDFSLVLDTLQRYGFIQKYEHENEYYGYVPSWHNHQKINSREPTSKLPDINSSNAIPSNENSVCGIQQSSARACACNAKSGMEIQMLAHLEVEMEKEMEVEMEVEGQAPAIVFEANAQTSISIPLKNHADYPITSNQVKQWEEVYPSINVLQTLKHIREWNLANPQRQKTHKGILRHITQWLAKENKQPTFIQYDKPHCRQSNSIIPHNLRVAEEWLRQHDVSPEGVWQ